MWFNPSTTMSYTFLDTKIYSYTVMLLKIMANYCLEIVTIGALFKINNSAGEISFLHGSFPLCAAVQHFNPLRNGLFSKHVYLLVRSLVTVTGCAQKHEDMAAHHISIVQNHSARYKI